MFLESGERIIYFEVEYYSTWVSVCESVLRGYEVACQPLKELLTGKDNLHQLKN